ncbi:MAG TPA: adenylate/guanylate cyclase domain-containing protein, partial [Myxococcales bacterium]|nr:adenylate/guanylate cyclase domain-containing protein [Myxococcales bacterium]
IGERQIALDQDDAVWLNFRGPAGSFPTVPVIDLMEGRLPAGALEDKIVLLGMTHLGQDRVRTPFSSAVPGVEIQATLVDNLLRGDPLRRTGWWTDGLLCLLVGLLVSLSFWPRLVASPPLQALAALFVVGAYLSTSGWLFAARDLWAPWLGPGLAFALAGAVCLTQSYLGEGRQRRRLRKAFAHYLGDEVIGELLENPRMLAPGGERRELSVLFSDIRDFTTYSERLSPEQIVAFLNTYLTPMTRAVLGTQGYLDKYIGDAIMAVFGAPVPRAEHAPQALDCALRMHRELDTLRPEAARLGIDLRIGVGVNTGEVIVGNMGAEERFDYTVAGDSVNLASRLEGLTKVYGVFCLVGERTRRAAGARFCFREVDLVQVKGKSQPVAIYELLGGGEHPVASYGQLDLFERGVERWRAGAFAEAHAAFLAFLEANPGDPVSRLYLERLDALGRTCPPGWTGVFVHVNK